MIKNYFFLIRQCRELSQKLSGAILTDAFTQEKDVLMIEFLLPGRSSEFLEISCSQQSAHLLIRESYHRAKKNTIDFFKTLDTQKLESVEIALYERVIKLQFASGTLYFNIHGNQTNVLFTGTDGNTESFLKSEEGEWLPESFTFYTPEHVTELVSAECNSLPLADFEKLYRIIGKDILEEAGERAKANGVALQVNVTAVLNEVFYSPFSLRTYTNPPRLLACPESFTQTSSEILRVSVSVNEIIKHRLIEQHKVEHYKKIHTQIAKHLQKEKAFLSQKISKMKPVIADASREQLYKKCADLLLSNLYLVEEKTTKIQLADYEQEGMTIDIKIDPALTPAHNADVYYAKARNAGKQRAQFAKELPGIEKKLERFIEQEKRLNDIKNLKEIEQLADEILSSGKNKEIKDNSPEAKFRRFYIFDQYTVLVGKDAHNNDVLTVQFAKPNDFWFHARSVSGSHVVVRNESNKDTLDKTVLQAAASLAAFYSKAKSAKLVPVAYTQKKYVVKRKGMHPGMVGLLKEKVVMVKPEIPAICIPYGAKDAEE
ncbi:MAG: DUF814 domain-containing protein [Ignavibacteriales bacterium]|nr:DUF814 domain-containing protein [Ignavibacteriales bacterium]